MELGMRQVDMDAEMARQEASWNFNSDTELETDLAHQHVSGELDCPWPWYADDPTEAVEREEFGP